MEIFCSIFILLTASLHLISSQTDAPALAELLQKNASFQTFLKDNPNIFHLLQTNPELVNQFQLNPNLISKTMEHAKFINSFFEEHANLNQIIKDNPSVYGFILKQVDHAVGTGQNSTIVIEMSEADVNEAKKELQEAQKNINSQTPAQTSSGRMTNNGISGEADRQTNNLTALSREQMLALLTSYQQILGNQTPQSNPNQSSGQLKTSSGQISIINGPNSTVGNNSDSSFSQEDLLNLNNLDDLNRLNMLYIAMYNKQPKNVQDLQDFYTVILAQLNIRTRKQVLDFLARFKSNGSQMSGSTGNGYNNAFGYNNGVNGRPSLHDRIAECKKRKFCRWNPSSVICRQEPPPPTATATSWFKKLGF